MCKRKFAVLETSQSNSHCNLRRMHIEIGFPKCKKPFAVHAHTHSWIYIHTYLHKYILKYVLTSTCIFTGTYLHKHTTRLMHTFLVFTTAKLHLFVLVFPTNGHDYIGMQNMSFLNVSFRCCIPLSIYLTLGHIGILNSKL